MSFRNYLWLVLAVGPRMAWLLTLAYCGGGVLLVFATIAALVWLGSRHR